MVTRTSSAGRRGVSIRALGFSRKRRAGGADEGAQSASARAARKTKATRAKRVLLVDDEQPLRIVCRMNLELAGLEVVEAANGTEALALAVESQPDIVLLDVMMPELDGWEVARRLAAREETRDIPVVFLTARASAEDLQKGADVGGIGYVIKPFDPIELPRTLERMLERLARGEREALRREFLDMK
jgi:CheY-like chemotaxis protein